MERLTAARALAVGNSLRSLDRATSAALIAHAGWLAEAEHTLREASIQLSVPQIQTLSVQNLRDRIDALLGITPRAMPISQEDGS